MKYATIITSIHPVNNVIRDWLRVCESTQGQLAVVGDVKTPHYDLLGCTYLSYGDQLRMDFKSATVTPPNNYARKNLGYLWAISQGAPIIYETDDDNSPLDSWQLRTEESNHELVAGGGWQNVYKWMGMPSWPRGYSLANIKRNHIFLSQPVESVTSPIQQGMIRGDSDVDAIYRLTNGKELAFDQERHVAFQRAWCPFNSQSTWWWPSAYPLMYLPNTCPMRATDIWRSFVAQRCLRAVGQSVVYHSPAEVVQVRNSHNLMLDFKQEVDLYLHTDRITEGLDELDLGNDTRENMVKCYDLLVRNHILATSELFTLKAWLQDIELLC